MFMNLGKMLLKLIILIFVHLCVGRHLQADPAKTEVGMYKADNAPIHSIPSIAHLTLFAWKGSKQVRCAGVLIHKRFVLTAAHCFTVPMFSIDVYLSAYKEDDSDFKYRAKGTHWWTHEAYKDGKPANNIAVIYLRNPVVLVPGFVEVAKWASTAEYPANEHVYEGKQLTVYGWGAKQEKPAKLPKTMQMLQVKAVPLSECGDILSGHANSTLCLKRADGKEGMGCAGDNGNPLVLDGVVVGIFRPTGCNTTKVAQATRIDYLRPWIEDKLRYYWPNDPTTY